MTVLQSLNHKKTIYWKMSTIRSKKTGLVEISLSYTDGVERTDSKTLTISPVKLVSIDKPDDTVYTGTEIKPEPAVYANVGGNDEKLVKDVDYTLSYSNNIDAGTATVTAEGKGNFTGTVSSDWKINNAQITVKNVENTYEYDGELHGVGINISTINDQKATVKYGVENGNYEYGDPVQINHVSESKTIYYQVSAPNHDTVHGSYSLEITPRTAELIWGDLSWTYDGKLHETICTVGNLITGDTCIVEIEGNGITEIGTKTVNAVSLSNTDYVLPLTGLEQILTINGGLYIKDSGIWIPVKDIYRKTPSGWTKIPYDQIQTELSKNSGKFVRKTT